LHGYETWSSAVTKYFVNKTLESKTEGATVRQKNVRNDKFPNFCPLANIIKLIK